MLLLCKARASATEGTRGRGRSRVGGVRGRALPLVAAVQNWDHAIGSAASSSAAASGASAAASAGSSAALASPFLGAAFQ